MSETLIEAKEQKSVGDGTVLYNQPNNTKSSFTAKTVNVGSLTAYKMIEIFFTSTASSYQNGSFQSIKTYKVLDGQAVVMFNTDGPLWHQRRAASINWTTGDITFEGGYLLNMSDNSNTADNSRCVPYAIVGYK